MVAEKVQLWSFPLFSVRLDYFQAFDCCRGSNAICLKRNLVSIDSAFPRANTLIARSLSCSVFLNFGNVFWVIYCPLLDNFRNKFIWHPSSPIFFQVCLLYPELQILLLPPQQCFGCIGFADFFRVFNALSTSNRPKCIQCILALRQ